MLFRKYVERRIELDICGYKCYSKMDYRIKTGENLDRIEEKHEKSAEKCRLKLRILYELRI